MPTPIGRRIDDAERVRRELGETPPGAAYPVRGDLPPLARETVAEIARILERAGWPPIRHQDDYVRLILALRWVASDVAPRVRSSR
ncbi:hypothetical protein LG943_00725 [Streptomonospora sp. S1-112]|uniref:Uncharacterized protein n=1 Tax=Streptomonospora mangrovi TaxID=2883123 RepID=A0A9X3NG09_9ACTN|nr:hypothetical protein [Streptomonospora mangrovi]MDA0562867.1 hypothetical protein [Streptomonospora mangrovi]